MTGKPTSPLPLRVGQWELDQMLMEQRLASTVAMVMEAEIARTEADSEAGQMIEGQHGKEIVGHQDDQFLHMTISIGHGTEAALEGHPQTLIRIYLLTGGMGAVVAMIDHLEMSGGMSGQGMTDGQDLPEMSVGRTAGHIVAAAPPDMTGHASEIVSSETCIGDKTTSDRLHMQHCNIEVTQWV